MDGLFLVQRPVSMGGWIKGNIDEVDDNVALKKLTALQDVVNLEINKLRSKRTKLGDNSYGEERLKWLDDTNDIFYLDKENCKFF